MMLFKFLLVLSTVGTALAKCPKNCSCPLDEKGRWQVLCLEGNLKDPLPVMQMPSQTEVLVVSAPMGSKNILTLGPIFKGLNSLEEIHVTHSAIPALGQHSFWGLRKLYLLNVSHNHITTLLVTNFRGPDSLLQLDLSYNTIESAPSAVFRHLKKLEVLDLSHNRIPELVSRIFFGLSSLEKLDLSYNPLGQLQTDRFGDLPSLLELRCAGCGIMYVPSNIFLEVPELKLLDLSNNRLLSVPPVKMARKLSILLINGNHISKISKNDFVDFGIKDLYMSENRLISIEEGSFRNTSLKTLDMSYNRLSALDPNVLKTVIEQLEILKLSGNSLHIDQLIQILPKAKQLRELGIGDLGLTRLTGDILKRSRHLNKLNISSNYLSKFPHELLYSTPSLRVLDLSSNSFRKIEENLVGAFTAMPSLTSVYLERNPWQCHECHISHLIKWLKSSPKQPHSFESCKTDSSSSMCLKCVGPQSFAGKPLLQLTPEELETCTFTSQTLWSTWDERQNKILQADEPQSSGSIPHSESAFGRASTFFKDHLALVIGVGCGMILALLLVIVTSVICSQKQSAYYYTSEEDLDKKEKLVGRNNNDSPVTTPPATVTEASKLPPYVPMAISKVHSKRPIQSTSKAWKESCDTIELRQKPTIATIEELAILDSSMDRIL